MKASTRTGALSTLTALAMAGFVLDAAAKDITAQLPPMSNRPADGFIPARAPLSVWLEEMKLPPIE